MGGTHAEHDGPFAHLQRSHPIARRQVGKGPRQRTQGAPIQATGRQLDQLRFAHQAAFPENRQTTALSLCQTLDEQPLITAQRLYLPTTILALHRQCTAQCHHPPDVWLVGIAVGKALADPGHGTIVRQGHRVQADIVIAGASQLRSGRQTAARVCLVNEQLFWQGQLLHRFSRIRRVIQRHTEGFRLLAAHLGHQLGRGVAHAHRQGIAPLPERLANLLRCQVQGKCAHTGKQPRLQPMPGTPLVNRAEDHRLLNRAVRRTRQVSQQPQGVIRRAGQQARRGRHTGQQTEYPLLIQTGYKTARATRGKGSRVLRRLRQQALQRQRRRFVMRQIDRIARIILASHQPGAVPRMLHPLTVELAGHLLGKQQPTEWLAGQRRPLQHAHATQQWQQVAEHQRKQCHAHEPCNATCHTQPGPGC